jgi:hypothetical protein
MGCACAPQGVPPHSSQSSRESVGWRLQVVLASLRALHGGSFIGVSPGDRTCVDPAFCIAAAVMCNLW